MIGNDKSQGTVTALNIFGISGRRGLSTKAILAIKLNAVIEERGLSQVEVANITGMTQPKVSQIHRNKLQNISLERLMQALVALDYHVEIIIRPAHQEDSAKITVAA